jgi:hypothetical protein
MSSVVVCGRKIEVGGQILRVARIDGDYYRFLEDPSQIIAALPQCGTRVDLFTFMQRLPDTKPKYSYPMEWDNLAVLPVTTFEDWWTKVLGFKGRNKAKQAEKKGVVIREAPLDESMMEGMWKIYNETPIRQGKRFPHYGMTLERMREYAGTFLDSSVFLGAYVENELIGFAKLTLDETATQAGLMHILSMVRHRDKAPTNALIAHAVRACADRNIPYLVYSSFAYGKKQRDSLSDFKERNGFARVDIPRYYVPLTGVGKLAFRMGLHRKLIDRLPQPLIERLREYRAGWYSRTHQLTGEAG